MNINQWIEYYHDKSGDLFAVDLDSPMEFSEEHGFCQYNVVDEYLVLSCVCGDGKYWDAWAINKARELGLQKILFMTYRNPAAWERKHGYKVCGYVMSKEVV